MANLNRMLELLDEVNITNVVGMKHDIAREQYVVTRRTVDSYAQFNEEITRFVQYQLHATLGNTAIPQYMASSQAVGIVERAFTSVGGLQGAYEIASTGIRGGLRAVIDTLYQAIKKEEEEAYVEYILRTEVDPLSFEDRAQLMQAYLSRFGHNFPQGIRVPTAYELAGNYESIIRMHTEVINAIRMGIRRH